MDALRPAAVRSLTTTLSHTSARHHTAIVSILRARIFIPKPQQECLTCAHISLVGAPGFHLRHVLIAEPRAEGRADGLEVLAERRPLRHLHD